MTKELLQGSGGVNLSPLMEGAPNAWMFEFQANNMGINSKANKDKAIKDITSAMEKAGNLPTKLVIKSHESGNNSNTEIPENYTEYTVEYKIASTNQ